jgi:SAM-dependent methyltransferase
MSLERHRLLQILFDQHIGSFLDGGRVLHFAPEEFIRTRLEKGGGYVSTDISGYNVHLACSMESLPFRSNCFRAVIANHVLEHVPDEGRALKELHRVTSSAGVVILSVPQVQGWGRTYEDSGITDPRARRVHFGQEDHRRLYGRDFKRRLVRAGFRVESYQAGYKNEIRFGLSRGETIYLARPLEKPTEAAQ